MFCFSDEYPMSCSVFCQIIQFQFYTIYRSLEERQVWCLTTNLEVSDSIPGSVIILISIYEPVGWFALIYHPEIREITSWDNKRQLKHNTGQIAFLLCHMAYIGILPFLCLSYTILYGSNRNLFLLLLCWVKCFDMTYSHITTSDKLL